MSVVEDVITYLAAASLVDGGTGWTSSRRAMHDNANPLLVVSEDGGMPPEIGRASGMGSAAFRDPGVLITCRAEPWQGDDSYDKAQACYDALHGLTDTVLGSTIYLRVMALTSGPVFAGFDDNNRPMHTIGFRLAVTQGAPA